MNNVPKWITRGNQLHQIQRGSTINEQKVQKGAFGWGGACLAKYNIYIYENYLNKHIFQKKKDEGCFSDVRGPVRTTNPKTSQANGQYENGTHFWDFFEHVRKHVQKFI